MPTFCHLPIAIIVGAVTEKVLARDGKPVVRPVLPLAIELDHRFVDGYQAATMARIFRGYLADPAAYDPVPGSIPPRKRRRAPARPNGRRPATAGRSSSSKTDS
jgi:pyruvate dehydrogenase E2 component (dihydrolipoamide acetyltransferase)